MPKSFKQKFIYHGHSLMDVDAKITEFGIIVREHTASLDSFAKKVGSKMKRGREL